MSYLFGGWKVPQRMELDHYIHLVSDGRPDLAERLQSLLEVCVGDVVSIRRLGVGVKRPDLHPPNTLREQVLRQLVCPVQKGVEVLVRAFGFVLLESPVAHHLSRALAHVAVAGAGVVGAYPLPVGAAEELVDWLAGGFAEEVPECYVYSRVASSLGAAASVAEVVIELSGVLVYMQGFLAEQGGGGALVDVGLRRPRPEEGLAEAGEALIGVDEDPEDVRELLEAERLYLRNFHLLVSIRRGLLSGCTPAGPTGRRRRGRPRSLPRGAPRAP